MNRRNFLQHTSLTGLAVTATGVGALAQKGSSLNTRQDMGNKTGDFSLNEVTIDELQHKMATNQLSSEKITRLYLKRIGEIDKNGPSLNAVIEINPDAISIAVSLDKERKAGKVRGPMHGIPVLIKDNISTADKMMTTAGALALNGHIASKDAFIVKQLRDAGAVLLGKTNLSEWANFRSSRATSGWSSRGGQTKCPYILDRNPSGSSAGSGAATAANLCTVAIGTETNGSIVAPASTNGVVGIKPTVGLWSRTGIIPISETQDTAGPMARNVRDAATLLGALVGIDTDDTATPQSKNRYFTDYTKFLDKDALKGKRIGIEKTHLKGHEGVVGLFRESLNTMTNHGATIVELDILKAMSDIGSAEFTVLLYEFKDGVNRYLANSGSKMGSLQDVINFNNEHESLAMPFFKQETLIASQEKGDLSTREYTDALAKVLTSRTIISNMVKQNNLDALCGVTKGPACCIDLVNGDYGTGFSLSGPAAMAGFPHITLPMGSVHDLPVGISFFSTEYTEPVLLSIAYAFEQATGHRTPPALKMQLMA